MLKLCLFIVMLTPAASANPYWNESKVPKTPVYYDRSHPEARPVSIESVRAAGEEVIRVEVSWESGEIYRLTHTSREFSGTPALVRRSKVPSVLGSYKGILIDRRSGEAVAYDAVGTGKEFRKLTRALTFRFPLLSGEYDLRVIAENPQTGVMETVLQSPIDIPAKAEAFLTPIEVRHVAKSMRDSAVKVVIYAEGYTEARKDLFFHDANRVAAALNENGWPGIEHMDIQAVFGASQKPLGAATHLGLPVEERDSFLGLYYPYWHNFRRWYHIVYPTRESKYRQSIGQVPYDYPIALVDSADYWGVGTFNEITAIPSRSSAFVYLLFHELGHFFGLNEEYDGGGTELQFAESILEPWSQNITFTPTSIPFKWSQFIEATTPIPTPKNLWNVSQKGPIGAYVGGYASSPSPRPTHKPGLSCYMDSSAKFCPVCDHAIRQKIKFDLGRE